VTPEGTTTYGYFPNGLAKSTAFFDNLTYEGRCYDAAGRLKALVTARSAVSDACAPPPFVSRYQYELDAEGNRVSQVEELTPAGGAAPGPAEVTGYGYDEESRLVGVRYPDDTVALYQLDAVGNRVGERKAASSMVPALTVAAFLAVSPSALSHDVVAVFNGADWLESVRDSLAPEKDATFEWDAAGNLSVQHTAGRDRHFSWDVKQTLTKVEDNGLEAGRYDYGADGLRSKRVTAVESVEYVLDGMQVLVEADGASNGHPAKRRYTYAANALAVTDISGATRTTKALHLDALRSPGTETTQAGVVAKVRQYDAWGQYRYWLPCAVPGASLFLASDTARCSRSWRTSRGGKSVRYSAT
jgi:YD repeat-containing protein